MGQALPVRAEVLGGRVLFSGLVGKLGPRVSLAEPSPVMLSTCWPLAKHGSEGGVGGIVVMSQMGVRVKGILSCQRRGTERVTSFLGLFSSS